MIWDIDLHLRIMFQEELYIQLLQRFGTELLRHQDSMYAQVARNDTPTLSISTPAAALTSKPNTISWNDLVRNGYPMTMRETMLTQG